MLEEVWCVARGVWRVVCGVWCDLMTARSETEPLTPQSLSLNNQLTSRRPFVSDRS